MTPETYNLYYDGPAGERGYYHVRAEEVAPGAFNVRVLTPGHRAGNPCTYGTVTDAEAWILRDRHRVACERMGCRRSAAACVSGRCKCLSVSVGPQ